MRSVISGRRLIEFVWVTAASAALLAVIHDVPYLLDHPFWLDEAWVGISARLPVTELLSVSSSSPPGWLLTLRPFAPLGEQAMRLVPLLFQVLTLVAAYALVRVLLRGNHYAPLYAAVVSVALALAPAALERNDLKQYSCDAAFAVIILLTCALVSRNLSRRAGRLALTILCVAAVAFSIPSAFVSGAAFISIVLVLAVRRDRQSLGRWLLAGGAALAGIAGMYFALYARADIQTLNTYWDAFYPTVAEVPPFVLTRAQILLPTVGIAPGWLALPLAFLGLVLLWIRGHRVVALIFPVLLLIMVGVGVARRYPLLDTRTSYFLVVLLGLLAVLGVILLAEVLLSAVRLRGRRYHYAAAALLLAGALLTFGWVGRASIGIHNLQPEDTRSQVEYLESEVRPGDVVIANTAAGFGVAYYLDGEPVTVADPLVGMGFRVDYGPDSQYVVAPDADLRWFTAARERARENGGRLWLVLSHATPDLREEWLGSLHNVQFSRHDVGYDPVWLIREDLVGAP